VLFRAAAHDPAPDALLAKIEAILGLNESGVMRYADVRRGQRRALLMDKAGGDKPDLKLTALLLAGDTEAEAWIKPLLQDRLPAQAYGRQLLLPGSKAPLAVPPRAHQVCTCFNVSAADITGCLGKSSGQVEDQLLRVQAELQCGTNCGSCLPEVRAMVVKHTESIRDLQTA
jgi:assimilatory nitrate reductase catalytic subunit